MSGSFVKSWLSRRTRGQLLLGSGRVLLVIPRRLGAQSRHPLTGGDGIGFLARRAEAGDRHRQRPLPPRAVASDLPGGRLLGEHAFLRGPSVFGTVRLMKPQVRSDTGSGNWRQGTGLGIFKFRRQPEHRIDRSLCSRPPRRPKREKPCRPGKLTAESPLSRPRELGREAGNDTNLSAHGSDGGAKTKLRVRITKGGASHASIRILLKATPPSQTRKRFETKKPRDSPGSRGFCWRAPHGTSSAVCHC